MTGLALYVVKQECTIKEKCVNNTGDKLYVCMCLLACSVVCVSVCRCVAGIVEVRRDMTQRV